MKAGKSWPTGQEGFGILKHARMIDSNEAMQLLSDVRLGVDLGAIESIPLKKLNELLVLTRRCLQYLTGKTLNAYERDLERAAQIQRNCAVINHRQWGNLGLPTIKIDSYRQYFAVLA